MRKFLFLIAFIASFASAQSGTAVISVKLDNVATKTGSDSLKNELDKTKLNQSQYQSFNSVELAQIKDQLKNLSIRHDSLVQIFSKQNVIAPIDSICCFRKYVTIPASTYTTGTAIVPGDFCCGTLANGTYNFASGRPPGDYKTAGLFTGGFSVRQADGAYRFVNTAGDVFGTQGVGQNHGISTTNAAAYNLTFTGLSAAAPIVVTGENGIQLPSASGGATLVIQNVVARTTNASGLTANFGISGSNYYSHFTETYLRAFNTGQEGICYLGNTGASYDGTNYHDYATVTHCLSYNSQRESVQVEHVNHLAVSHVTGILPGQTATSGQRNSLQVHDCNGYVKYFIFDGSPFPANIFTHGVTISDGYFGFTEGAGFIGRTDNAYFSASPRLNGDSLIFENLYINYTGVGTLAYVWLVEERVAHIIMRNCHFSSNITKIFQDNRAVGYTNTITGNIGDHGNVAGTITLPSYVTNYSDQDNYDQQGLLKTSSPYFVLHYGYRTP